MLSRLRQNVLESMEALSSAGVDCSFCEGTCCTFVSNTMQIGEAEARDLADWVAAAPDPDFWKQRIEHAISKYRLEAPPIGDGRRSFVRRRYTCPFFTGVVGQGCAVPRDVKPVGCLRFNPVEPKLEAQGGCRLMGEGLELQEGETLPIPVAVINCLDSRLLNK